MKGYLCLFPKLRMKWFNLSPISVMLAVGFLQALFLRLKKFLSISILWRHFTKNVCLIQINAFFPSSKLIWFYIFFFLMLIIVLIAYVNFKYWTIHILLKICFHINGLDLLIILCWETLHLCSWKRTQISGRYCKELVTSFLNVC